MYIYLSAHTHTHTLVLPSYPSVTPPMNVNIWHPCIICHELPVEFKTRLLFQSLRILVFYRFLSRRLASPVAGLCFPKASYKEASKFQKSVSGKKWKKSSIPQSQNHTCASLKPYLTAWVSEFHQWTSPNAWKILKIYCTFSFVEFTPEATYHIRYA